MTKHKKKILVLDDDAATRRFVAEVVSESGFSPIEADSVERAFSITDSHTIDGFLLDVNLADGNGIDVCRRLRSTEQHRTSPIIILTGFGEIGIAEEAFAAGCDDFVAKPVTPSLLRARLKTHLQRVENIKEIQSTRTLLDRYVSRRTKQMIALSVSSGEKLVPQERNVVICFTDVRGFTALSEEIEPSLLFSVLSDHMARQEEFVHRCGGYIDKFGGDGIMAVFDGDDMARRSCLCALAILDRSRTIDDGLSQKLWRVGIGIHTGRVIMGNFGSPEHLDYTVIGKSVNIAARLCGQADPMTIVVSGELRNAVADTSGLDFHSMRQVAIRGLKEPMTIFNLSGG